MGERFRIVQFEEKPSEYSLDPPHRGCVYLREGETKGPNYECRVLGTIEVSEQSARGLCGLTQLMVNLDSTQHSDLPHAHSHVRDGGPRGSLPGFSVMATQALDAAKHPITGPALRLTLIEDN